MLKCLVYGTEPYLIDKYRKEIRDSVETPEFNYLETDEVTKDVLGFLQQLPLLGNEKVLIFRATCLKDCRDLLDFMPRAGKKSKVYFFVKEIDKRTKEFKQFSKDEMKMFDKISGDVFQYVKKNDCEIQSEAYEYFLQIINYYSEETNLYDVINALKRLCSTKVITVEVFEKMIISRETENIFSLIQLIMSCRYEELYRQADLIILNQGNNIIGILSLLLRSYRLAYKMQVCNCNLKTLGVYGNTYVPRLSADACNDAMNLLDDAVNNIKRGFYSGDIALKVTLTKLCEIAFKDKNKQNLKNE